MYNSSTSLQNAILNILSNNGSTVNTYAEENTIVDEIQESSEDERVEPPKSISKPATKPAPKPKRAATENEALIIPGVKANPNKVLTATEIIYRAMLNDQEFEDNISGGKRADDMLDDNLLKGGNIEGNADVLDEIHESNTPELMLPSERAQANIFSGGNSQRIAGGDFSAALQRYKSTQDAVEAISTSSSEYNSDDDPPFTAVAHAGISLRKNEDTDNSDSLESEDANALGLTDDSASNYSSDSDDFIPNPNVGKSMKTTNAKYIRLIKEFKTQSKPSTILGGSVNRPKTVTVVNAFPYIIKSNPDSK